MKYNMNGDYPRMANWVLVRRLETGMFEVKNILTNERYEFGEMIWRFLKDLDGDTDPYDAAVKWGVDIDKLEEIMEFFEDEFLVRDKRRTIWLDVGQCCRTVFIPKKKRTRSIIPVLYNLFLLLAWCPILLWGISTALSHEIVIEMALDKCFEIPNFIVGFILGGGIGMVVHEISHAMAGLAYGGYFCEMGIMWKYISPGAYVIIETDYIKSKLKKIQIDAAGVEMNMLVTGICLILSVYCEPLSSLCLWIAIYNIGMVVINLTFLDGLDGSHIITECLGLEDELLEISLVFREFFSRFKKKTLTMHHIAVVVTSVILFLYQCLWWSFILNNILSVIGAFL